MADSSDSQTSILTENEEAQSRQALDELKKDLEGWREAFLPLRSLLLWEKPYYPAIIFKLTTLVFALIWMVEPSVLTSFAVLGVVMVGVDFILPFVSPYLFAHVQWTVREEELFEDTCERILYFQTHVKNFVQGMTILKQERPKLYFLLVMGTLIFFAWIGHMMNNLYLTYCVVLTTLMMPGLRQTGLMQRYVLKYWESFKRLVFGHLQMKTKTT